MTKCYLQCVCLEQTLVPCYSKITVIGLQLSNLVQNIGLRSYLTSMLPHFILTKHHSFILPKQYRFLRKKFVMLATEYKSDTTNAYKSLSVIFSTYMYTSVYIVLKYNVHIYITVDMYFIHLPAVLAVRCIWWLYTSYV